MVQTKLNAGNNLANEGVNVVAKSRVLNISGYDKTMTHTKTRSFFEAVNGSAVRGFSNEVPLKQMPLRVEGGNVIVEIDEDDIEREAL